MTTPTDRLAAALSDRYRLDRELGQGGMATVYLAHDLKHERDVAIKVLHPDLGAALGGERFLSEIRTTARLQHPHILPLLDSGEAEGLLYYVMPLVTGETLRARLERERQLPIDDALRIAREAADALGYAHGLGIVHRDIKPENILLQGGHALVADFGIALAMQTAGGARMTQSGMSLGTPQYMSPEQAMGERTIDTRSDVYALGAVTYEMLVGNPPFTGATVQIIAARVLTERPVSPRTVRDTVPLHVEHAVLRALAKLPADRWATTEKFADALAHASVPVADGGGDAERTGARGTPTAARRPLTAFAMAGALVTTAALTWWLTRQFGAAEAPWSSFTQLTDASGVETSPSLAPDGESFAYASNTRGSWDIYVQRVGGRNPVLVAGDSTADELWPAYAPDGKRIAYAKRGSGIYVVGATGESARRLTTFGSNPAWSPDGTRIVFGSEEVISPYGVNSSGGLWVVAVSGGAPRRIDAPAFRESYQPAWSPSGARIAFWTPVDGQRDIVTMPADGGAHLKVTNDAALDWAPVWSPDGRFLYFASDRGGTMGIWRVAVDEQSGRATAAPEPVASGVDVDMDLPRLSADGTSLLFRSKIESVNPAAVTFDMTAARLSSVALLQRRTGNLVPTGVSPDGRWLTLYNLFDRQQDIFIMRSDGSELTRLTDDPGRDWYPRFTPDGAAVTFYSNQGGKYEAFSIGVDGSGRTQLTDGNGNASFSMFAPDGKRLMVASAAKVPTVRIGTAPWPMMAATTTTMSGLAMGTDLLIPSVWSGDGRWLSGFVMDPSGAPRGHAIYNLETRQTRRLNDDSNGNEVGWLPGFRHVIYFGPRGTLVMQDIESLERRDITGTLPYPPDNFGSIVVAPDGRTLYYGARQIEANIWMVKRQPIGALPR